MRIVTFHTPSHDAQAGIVLDGNIIVPVRNAASELGLPQATVDKLGTVRGLLESGVDFVSLELGAQRARLESAIPSDEATLEPPIPDPDKIICVGLNYRDHAAEAGLDLPVAPILFAKYRNSLCSATADIPIPAVTNELDWEGELAVVIGRTCRGVGVDEAIGHVAGVMASNDLSARDLQNQTSQWLPGKAIDSFAPCGPELVTLDEVPDLQGLDIETRVNGEVMQTGNTASMIFTVAEVISFASSFMTLVPGDLILTGTPAGVGFSRNPPVFLGAGDLVEVSIDGVGTVANSLVSPSEGVA